MQLAIFLSAFLCLISGTSSAPAGQSDLASGDGTPAFDGNGTSVLSDASLLEQRAGRLGKREVFNRCSGQYAPFLATTIQDANDIYKNMIAHLELALSMFEPSGELLPDKRDKASRTFDEQNAIITYQRFIAKTYFGVGDSRNQAGYNKMAGTLGLATSIQEQLEKYLAGIPTTWLRGGIPYINIRCTDEDLYSATNLEGRTYSEDQFDEYGNPKPNPVSVKGSVYYWMSSAQLSGHDNVWVLREGVCDLGDGRTTRFLNPVVPVLRGVGAYVYGALFDLLEENMVFCPAFLAERLAFDRQQVSDGLHYRNLHVPIGGEPTQAQRQLAARLMSVDGQNVSWFKNFLVKTFVHESTHSVAFCTPSHQTLTDVRCTTTNFSSNGTAVGTTVTLECHSKVVQGLSGWADDGSAQGHRDAEAFATYAMALWINTVYWYKAWQPMDRSTYLS